MAIQHDQSGAKGTSSGQEKNPDRKSYVKEIFGSACGAATFIGLYIAILPHSTALENFLAATAAIGLSIAIALAIKLVPWGAGAAWLAVSSFAGTASLAGLSIIAQGAAKNTASSSATSQTAVSAGSRPSISAASNPSSLPAVVPTATLSTEPTAQASPKSQTENSNGVDLGSYSVLIAQGYSIPLGTSAPTQSQFDSTESRGDLDDQYDGNNCITTTTNDCFVPLNGDQMVQLQNGTTLTYQTCTSTSSAGFTSVVAGSQGTEFCVLEGDKIAGVEVISQSNNGYDLKVIVWRKASLHSLTCTVAAGWMKCRHRRGVM